jgi:hypothetical protein
MKVLVGISLCLAATNAFVIPTPSTASRQAATGISSATRLQVAAEIVNGETKPRKTREVSHKKLAPLSLSLSLSLWLGCSGPA